MSSQSRMLPPPADDPDGPLYQTAIEVERDERLTAEMAEWEEAALADGLGDEECQG